MPKTHIKQFEKFDFNIKKFLPIYAIEFLKACKLLKEENSEVAINLNKYKIGSEKLFMLDMTEREFNEIRSKFIARKYKYKKMVS